MSIMWFLLALPLPRFFFLFFSFEHMKSLLGLSSSGASTDTVYFPPGCKKHTHTEAHTHTVLFYKVDIPIGTAVLLTEYERQVFYCQKKTLPHRHLTSNWHTVWAMLIVKVNRNRQSYEDLAQQNKSMAIRLATGGEKKWLMIRICYI